MEVNYTIARLEGTRQVSHEGVEFWRARDLQILLGYDEWRNFEDVLSKARMACESSGLIPDHHFVDTNKMVEVGSGAMRKVRDVFLSRYACYLIAMNGDPNKPQIAVAQTYFAVQTRRQEIADQQTDEESRIALRKRVRDANKYLNSAAKKAGVQNYALFHDAGYRGLYGMGLGDIRPRRGLIRGKTF